MSDDTKTAANSVQIAGNANAPFVYFDHAPTYGVQGGAIAVELVARTILPEGPGTRNEIIVTGHLRCSPDSARELISALAKAVGMLEGPTDPLQKN